MSWGMHSHPNTITMAMAKTNALLEVDNEDSLEYLKAYRLNYLNMTSGENEAYEYLKEIELRIHVWEKTGEDKDKTNHKDKDLKYGFSNELIPENPFGSKGNADPAEIAKLIVSLMPRDTSILK
jgi:hypothetical protein